MKLIDGITLGRASRPAMLLAALLILIGLAFVYSASYRSMGDGEGYYTSSPQKQVVWALVGICVFLVVISIDYKRLIEWAYVFYGLGLLMLILTMAIGREVNYSRRWIDLGFFKWQTSELMKIAAILALARLLARWERRAELTGLIAPLLLAFVPVIIIARQPDLGTAMMFLPIVGGMVFVAGARGKHLLMLALAAVLAMPCLWFVMKPYQKERVLSFIQQDSDDPERQMNDLYHLTQSKAAIGSGGLLGKGWGKGTQNRLNFLPMRNTDFIFAVICEEWGFAGASAVLVLFFLFFWSCTRMAEKTRDPAGRLLVTGVTILFATQMLVNTAMSAGQFPTVGLPLPFMSYGGSSLLMCFVGLGLMVNVSMRPTILWGRDEDEGLERE
jgi:rod shape determining protein RodA